MVRVSCFKDSLELHINNQPFLWVLPRDWADVGTNVCRERGRDEGWDQKERNGMEME